MKTLHIAIAYASLATTLFASWPSEHLDTDAIAKNPEKVLSPLFVGHKSIYFSSVDFRRPTIDFIEETGVYKCSIPVAYYEVKDWLALSHQDTTLDGWTPMPAKTVLTKSGSCKNLVELIAILDSAGIKFQRTTYVRKEVGSGNFSAAWNRLEFNVPADAVPVVPFLALYFRGLPSGSEILIYND